MTMTRFRPRRQTTPAVRRSLTPASEERIQARREPVGVLLQRALVAPSTLNPHDNERLAQTLGNQGMAQLSARAGGQSHPDQGREGVLSPTRSPGGGIQAQQTVQRTPAQQGVVQRNVGKLIAFWEEQKKLNAPTQTGGGKGAGGQTTAPQVEGDDGGKTPYVLDQVDFSSLGGSDMSQVGGGATAATPLDITLDGGLTPVGTRSGTPFASFQARSGTGSGAGNIFQLGSGTGTGGSNVLQIAGGLSAWGGTRTPYSTLDSSVEATADRKRRERAARRNSPDPLDEIDPNFLAWFFYEGRQYDYRANVDEHYEGEQDDSTHWIFSKVLTNIGSKENFQKLDEDDQRRILGIGLKWAPENVEQFLLDHEMKVKYMKTEEERQEAALHLGSIIQQGSSSQPYDTSQMYANGVGTGHAIFVMAPDGQFYAGQHQIGRFHHSTFMAGSSVAAAGTLQVEQGTLKHITNKTGHYKSDDDHLRQALMQLKNGGVSLTSVKVTHFNESKGGFEDAPGGAEDFLQARNQPAVMPLAFSSLSSGDTDSSDSTTLSSGGAIFDPFGFGAVSTFDYELNKLTGGDPATALQNAGLFQRSGYMGQWFLHTNSGNLTVVDPEDQVRLLKGEIQLDDLRAK